MFIRVRLLLVDFCDSLRQTRCMKAVQVNDGVISVENVSEPRGDGVGECEALARAPRASGSDQGD